MLALVGVNADVGFGGPFLSERLLTYFACERFLIGVSSYVILEGLLPSEQFLACFACKRPLSGVNADMTIEVSFSGKRLLAYSAGMPLFLLLNCSAVDVYILL